jgi:hypothetical protein
MKKFGVLECVIASYPIIENESPFYLSFNVRVKHDMIPATFVGNFARSLKNNIKPGDRVIIRDGLIDNGRLVFDFMHMEPNTAIGRNLDMWG